MDQAAWQELALERCDDAKALLAAERWSAGYHLIGQAVECGFKACIITYVMSNPGVLFIHKRYSEEAWNHDPEKLARLADLHTSLLEDAETNPTLKKNWDKVKLWRVESRYAKKSRSEAERLYAAVTDQPDGVLQWIKGRW